MNLKEQLSEPKPLAYFVDSPSELPEWAWLYTCDPNPVSFSTLCTFFLIPSIELSDEEYEEWEALLEAAGYRSVLCREQIVDIVMNLLLQIPTPSISEVEEAITFFLENDAFIQK